MLIWIKRIIRRPVHAVLAFAWFPLLLVAAFLARATKRSLARPRLAWGSTPLINFSYWSRALKEAGYDSESVVTHHYTLNSRDDWDRVLAEECLWLPQPMRPYIFFLSCLFRYDVFFISLDGFFLGQTPLNYWQHVIFRLARKKVVVLPYGSDAYVYRRVRSTALLQGLLMSYPQMAREQGRIARTVDYWCKYADFMIPGIMGTDGLGRWDVTMPSQLHIDTRLWSVSTRRNDADGRSGVVRVVHAPNHRGFKGTEFVVAAVQALQQEGLRVELLLLEGIKNSEVRQILRDDTDILIEQLIFVGHGLNGLEGMASGLPVISNLEDENYTRPLRRWSYLNECPIVSASPETLPKVLRSLIVRPELRRELGRAGREYAEKYHSYYAAQHLFGRIVEYIYGRRGSLINFYHPLLGEYGNDAPKVSHPLVDGRVVDG